MWHILWGSSPWGQKCSNITVMWVCVCFRFISLTFLLSLQLSWWWPRLWGSWILWITGEWWTRSSSPPKHQRRRKYSAKATSSLWQVLSPLSPPVHWCSECVFISLICAFFFRENPAKSRNHCSVCERWASVSFVWGELIWTSISGFRQECFTHWRPFCHSHRGSLRKPGGLKFLTDTQWSSTSFAVTPGPKRPSYRYLWQRSPC